jgi:hypothetical protein
LSHQTKVHLSPLQPQGDSKIVIFTTVYLLVTTKVYFPEHRSESLVQKACYLRRVRASMMPNVKFLQMTQRGFSRYNVSSDQATLSQNPSTITPFEQRSLCARLPYSPTLSADCPTRRPCQLIFRVAFAGLQLVCERPQAHLAADAGGEVVAIPFSLRVTQ